MPKSLALIIVFILTAFGLTGCFNSSGVNTGVTVVMNWGTSSVSSEVVSLLDSSQAVIATKLLNRTDGNTVNFASVSATAASVVATAYDAPGGSGNVLGTVQRPTNVGATVQVAVGTVVSGVVVTPGSASVVNGTTTQFAAYCTDASGAAVLVPAGNFSWQVLGGVGTVDSSGRFLATTVGTGSVRATHTPTGVPGSAGVSVTAPVITKNKWTVFVYLNAANDLDSFGDQNVNQMEHVASNPDLRFVLQWKQSRTVTAGASFDGTRRYLVKPNTTSQVNSQLIQDLGSTIDMGSPQSLNDFVTWGQANYPSDHSILIIWNHGSGWNRSRAVSYDDERGTVIQTWELGQALAGHHFDIIAFDASLMQMLEVAYEIRGFADLIAGSEESPPGAGYPYDEVFKPFFDHPEYSPRVLSQGFVTGMTQHAAYSGNHITQSVLDTTKLPGVATALSQFADVGIANPAIDNPIFATARTNAQSYSPSPTRYYRDIGDLMRLVKQDPGVPADFSSAATAVQGALSAALVWEGHNTNSPNSTGLAIDATPGGKFANYVQDYRRLQLGIDAHWDEWLISAP